MVEKTNLNIFKTLRERLDAAFQLISYAEDRTEVRIKELVDKGTKLSREVRKNLEESLKRIQNAPVGKRAILLRREIEKMISDGVEKLFSALKLPTRKEFDNLLSRVEKLEKQLKKGKK
jgi:polyhydroxyalkanoate synthesis regulator phasin